MRISRTAFIAAACVVLLAGTAISTSAVTFIQGASLSSSNFRVLDPQHSAFGGTSSSSSSSYILLGAIGDVAVGSSSATSFGLRSGFLYFPLVIAPSLTSAVAGDGQVTLTWSAASADAGWSISGYNVCTKPSAGSFTCEDVGGVTTFVKSSLTNGTSYTFKVQAKDTFGNAIAESGQSSATPSGVTPTPTPTPTPAPAGGGVILIPTAASVRFNGFAYPDAVISILQDGIRIATVTGEPDGSFDFTNTNVAPGTYTFGFWAEDTQGLRSVTLSFPVTVSSGGMTQVVNIIIAPTGVLTTPSTIVKGDDVGIRGSATPNSQVRVRIEPGGQEFVVFAGSAGDGTYVFSTDTSEFQIGDYAIDARTEVLPGGFSPYSQLFAFTVADSLLPSVSPTPEIPVCPADPDVDGDGRVNLIDFSVLAFWFKRPVLPPNAPFDLNCDGKVQLDDFSILAFYWTG